MNRVLAAGLFWASGATVLLADDAKFSRQITPADFIAAGLAKLSPDELAKLDRLVQAYRSGAAAAQAAAEARAKLAEADAKEARAAQVAAEKRTQGFLAKTRALLLSGAEIEYQPLESRIVGSFDGWEAGSVFRLENGQRWQVEKGSDDYNGDSVKNPTVKIVAAAVSGFRMEVEGFPSVRVRLIGK